jgi:prepilin-type N-terminal cleavage/methylation domain-containing protein
VRPDPRRRVSDDSGFTLLETMVAIGLISTVMAAVTTFMVDSLRATDQQRVKQTAIQLADGAIEMVRNIDPTTLTTGRVAGLVDTTVTGQIPNLTAHLGDMEQYNVPQSGVTALLPLAPEAVTVNKVAFKKYWFLGRCWQPASGGNCTGPPGVTGSLLFYRIVAAVTWTGKPCGGKPCSYITSTLINSLAIDPEFNVNEAGQPPLIVNPGAISTGVSVKIKDVQMSASGGTKPYTWYVANLPPGLSMGTDGKITGTPTAAGVYQVTVTAKDANQLLGTVDLIWNVNPPPVLTPMTLVTSVGTAVALTPALSGGTAPYTWKATGLPTGLSINVDTGLISGTPTAVDLNKTLTPKITVTDNDKVTSTVDFSWQIIPALVVTAANQANTVGDTVNLTTNAATGGFGAYTWTVSGLPTGLILNPVTGAVTGKPTAAKAYTVVYTVTDLIGNKTTATVTWTVT